MSKFNIIRVKRPDRDDELEICCGGYPLYTTLEEIPDLILELQKWERLSKKEVTEKKLKELELRKEAVETMLRKYEWESTALATQISVLRNSE